jgi:hypothetical protein
LKKAKFEDLIYLAPRLTIKLKKSIQYSIRIDKLILEQNREPRNRSQIIKPFDPNAIQWGQGVFSTNARMTKTSMQGNKL